MPPETPITRTADEPAPASTWEERRERWLRIGGRWASWWSDAAVTAGSSTAGVRAIWTIMPPYGSAKPAAELARRLGVPWVADLGDPWALDEMTIYPTAAHRAAARREMRNALRSAGAVVMSTPEAVRRVREAFPELSDRPVVAIPNGYDAADFSQRVPPPTGETFRLVHSGYLHTDLGFDQQRRAKLHRVLRGQVAGVNVLTRSHFYLVQAIERLLTAQPELGDRLEVVFAGVLSDSDRRVAERLSVARMPGYLPHLASVDLVRRADLLFLPMQKLPAGMRATIVPGKTYEYLASGRPILAAVPEGDARDLVLAAGTGLVCEPDDVDGMAAVIRDQIERGHVESIPTDVSAFEYQQLATRVADVLDEIAG